MITFLLPASSFYIFAIVFALAFAIKTAKPYEMQNNIYMVFKVLLNRWRISTAANFHNHQQGTDSSVPSAGAVQASYANAADTHMAPYRFPAGTPAKNETDSYAQNLPDHPPKPFAQYAVSYILSQMLPPDCYD